MNTYPLHARWELITPKNEGPPPRAGHVSVIYENVLYIFGGNSYNRLYNDIWSYDLLTGYWTKIAAVGYIPIPRENSSATLVDGIIYVFGGRGPDSQELGDLCAFKIKSQRWYMFQNMGPTPSARFGLTFTAIKDKMYVLGGESGIGKMDDASLVYVLDSAKIKYPPEEMYSLATDTTTPPSPVTSNSTLVTDSLHMQSTRLPMLSMERNLESSQSTPLQSPRMYQNTARSIPQYEKNELGYSGDILAELPRPQPSVSTPVLNSSYQTPARLGNHTPTIVPEAAKRRVRHHSPKLADYNVITESTLHQHASSLSEDTLSTSPVTNRVDRFPQYTPSIQSNISTLTKAPPRPSREGINLIPNGRNVVRLSHDNGSDLGSKIPRSLSIRAANSQSTTPDIAPPTRSSSISGAARNVRHERGQITTRNSDTLWNDERTTLIGEIKSRDTIISEMKKKEQWWRAEVSVARKTRALHGRASDGHGDDDAARLLDFQANEPDKLKVFEHLIIAKSELRRIKAGIVERTTSGSHEIDQADQTRIAALKEAAYFKSKYYALRANRVTELADIEAKRAEELERRLEISLRENENNSRLLQKLQKQAQLDHSARILADERAKEEHERAEDARQAHKKALDELLGVHDRAVKAEAQVRDNTVRIADLTTQLANALTRASTLMEDLSPTHIQLSKLEASRLAARNEAATVRQRLVESMDDVSRLRTLLGEKEESLGEAKRQLENFKIQLDIMRDTMNQANSLKIAINGLPSP
ncbi:Negative regulator of mitotic exit [Apophysomyces sp. BC1034]|nr:Negative regulator of mitotic exit [Apophysomyces sp. BC1015]KAG0174487.1 Negative regulator of mitotic exit [Apophysomyces sp. BC1021]KAG0185789.1 Negative regulator of mitotic exit [Apophysomyces sp. BC1034]